MNSVRSRNSFLVQNFLNLFTSNQQLYSTSQIRIPHYIPRSKTDILEALESTVQQCPSVLPYGYFSDPHLQPKNSRQLQSYALAKESGVKAAQYFMKNYPELFYRDQAEPKVEKLSYPDVFSKDMDFDLNDIQSSIDKRNVSNAIIAFKKLSAQNVDIPLELKLNVFQLCCFFNSADAFEFVEELPFTRKMSLRFQERQNLWNLNGYAEEMWRDIFSNENNIDANSAYIQGLIRFGALNKAYSIYKEFEEKKKDFDLDAINSIIQIVPFNQGNTLEETKKLLKLINEKSFEPTIETINALLFAISVDRKSDPNEIISFAQQILIDCRILKLKPNLGTHTFTLNILYKDPQTRDDQIYRIIENLEKSPIHVTCKDDLLFFDEAMRVAAQNLSDSKLAIRIYNLFKKNNDLYLNIFREQNIYENFFVGLAKGESTEVLFDYYFKICPGIFFPSMSIFESLVDHLIVFSSFDYIELLFKELDKYSYHNANSLNHKIYHLIVSVPRSEKTDEIFTSYLFKALGLISSAQLKMDKPDAVMRNQTWVNQLLEHLLFLDQQIRIANFIIEYGNDLKLIERKNSKKFYSKLVEKLIDVGKVKEVVDILKFVIAKEVGELDENLPKIVADSQLTNTQKQLIKNLLLMC